MHLTLIFLAMTVIPPLVAGRVSTAYTGPDGSVKILVYVTQKVMRGRGCKLSWLHSAVSTFHIHEPVGPT
jgi:hypothetical protein